MKTISKLLVANRGEIAIRIFRAATELKIKTVAIYTFEDRYSLHRYKADESYQIGKDSEPLKPYLDIDEIINVAIREGVDAIHPGYGFLSENVEFATKCIQNNILWVGPNPSVMAQLGDKVAAKKIALKANVPLILDSQIPLNSFEIVLKEAQRIGYPIMVKAAAGGGGRGMRVVREESMLESLYHEAKREAKTAFGDDTLFIEKFIESPKHIEVQILGDNHGTIIHLFERDCSVQRRFQKVIEIAPAPNLKQETKNKLYQYALAIANEVNYNNAGTVEFLVDKEENIFFIEVNPRIQVEHTVTEEVTGIDIVRSQILIACGHALSSAGIYILSQESIVCKGFAIQCRITTEDPTNNFTPDYGTIIAYRNAGGYGIRIDEGSSYAGVKISPFFDSMLVKITARGRTLKGASQRLSRTLHEFRIRGVKTNIPFLENVIIHPDFQSGNITVNFIGENPELLQFKKGSDSSTKNLKYIANTIVNGNTDVPFILPNKTFVTPKLPDSSNIAIPPSGTKQLLEKLGPKEFSKWISQQNNLLYTDCTLRDAHQSLLATRVRTKDMLPFASSFAKHFPQMFSMEVWGGATFDVAMRFLNECPWNRLEQLREAMPNVLLQMLLRGSNGVGYTAYPDNLVEKFIEVSAEKGIDIFRIFDSLNSIDNMKTSIRKVLSSTNSIAEVCMNYSGDISNPERTKFTLQYYIDLAKRIEDTGAHILCIKDMAGLLKPYAAQELITELKNNIQIPIHLHTHDTAGIQSATYLKAVESGVDIIDVALSSMSGLTSQPNFNVFVEAMKGTPRHSDFDVNLLNQYSNYWEDVREYYYPFESGLKASTAEIYKHEIPGGQYSNLKPQAYSLGLQDRMTDIKQAYEDANSLFGDIIKVTPSSKVVGDLAMFMVNSNLTKKEVLEKGNTLSFPDSVKGMLLGELGQPDGGWPKEFQKMVLKDAIPFTDLPNKHLTPINFEVELEAFQNQFDASLTLPDFLSYKFYPKVFEEYYKSTKEWGNISYLPTTTFFYGLKPNEEIIINIGKGKNIIVKFLYKSEPDEKGICHVYFKLNGQTRTVEIKDNSIKSIENQHKKAISEKEIGAPLPGLLSKIWVKKGDTIKLNQSLFTIEAMKMENTVLSNHAGIIEEVVLEENKLVELGDMIIIIK